MAVQTWSEAAGNLSPGAANKRVRFGLIMLAVGLVLTVLLYRFDVSRYWHLLVLIPFQFAANGFLQGLYRT